MIVSAVLLLFVCTSALVIAQMPGGWRKANPDDDNVVKAATFAVNTKFPDQKVEFTVREAMTQVVAGINYDLLVDVTPPGLGCEANHFRVYDRFGDYSLTQSEVIPIGCPPK